MWCYLLFSYQIWNLKKNWIDTYRCETFIFCLTQTNNTFGKNMLNLISVKIKNLFKIYCAMHINTEIQCLRFTSKELYTYSVSIFT